MKKRKQLAKLGRDHFVNLLHSEIFDDPKERMWVFVLIYFLPVELSASLSCVHPQ
jgi:hypothetical protein